VGLHHARRNPCRHHAPGPSPVAAKVGRPADNRFSPPKGGVRFRVARRTQRTRSGRLEGVVVSPCHSCICGNAAAICGLLVARIRAAAWPSARVLRLWTGGTLSATGRVTQSARRSRPATRYWKRTAIRSCANAHTSFRSAWSSSRSRLQRRNSTIAGRPVRNSARLGHCGASVLRSRAHARGTSIAVLRRRICRGRGAESSRSTRGWPRGRWGSAMNGGRQLAPASEWPVHRRAGTPSHIFTVPRGQDPRPSGWSLGRVTLHVRPALRGGPDERLPGG
jgi:hypothetical protein